MRDDLIERLRGNWAHLNPNDASEAADRLAALQAERDYAVGEMREAREYLNIETTHAREAEAQAAALQQRVEELTRENERNRTGFEFHAGRAERERDRAIAAETREKVLQQRVEELEQKRKPLRRSNPA